MRAAMALLAVACLLLAGCAMPQQPAASPAPATATPQASQVPVPTAVPLPPQSNFSIDGSFVAAPIYIGREGAMLSAIGPRHYVNVRTDNGSVFFQDYFNPGASAYTRAITNPNQPGVFLFNAINNGTDSYDGRIVVETDLPPRAGSTSFAFVNAYPTENVFARPGQNASGNGYFSSKKPVVMEYAKVPVGEGFVFLPIVFFPTNEFESSAEGFADFMSANRGWKYIRVLHESANSTVLVAEINLLFE